jgi:hypothetical protein
MRNHLLFLSSLAALGACSPYSPTLPEEPFLCGQTDPKCPDGYACMGMDSMNRPVCMSSDGSGTPPVDGHVSGFDCADDSQTEGANRNDDISHAWQTPINMGFMTFPLAGLAICPSGDKDTYAVNVTTDGQNISAVVEYQADGAALAVTLLSSSGTAVASSTPNGANMVKATLNNAAAGSSPYYFQVAAPMMGENNYKVTFTVTGP